MLAEESLKSLYTKGFQHIIVPRFALLKTFFRTLQNGGGKMLFKRILTSKVSLERRLFELL